MRGGGVRDGLGNSCHLDGDPVLMAAKGRF